MKYKSNEMLKKWSYTYIDSDWRIDIYTPDLGICVGLFLSYLQFGKGHQKIKPKDFFLIKLNLVKFSK
jgi:hypothetical protein